MARYLYSIVFTLLLPVIVVRLMLRARKAPAYGKRWWQRFGIFKGPKQCMQKQGGIWFHTVSVGEFMAAAAMIEDVMKRYPEKLITITTTTPTGSEQVQKRFAAALGKQVFHVYLPYDLPIFLNRFLSKVSPQLLVILETELWPNLIHCSKTKGCKVMVVNARLSEKSAKGYHKVRLLSQPMLQQIDQLAVQNSKDAERFKSLGMPASKLQVTGSIKFDLTIDDGVIERGREWRNKWGSERPVICVASTHEGEDSLALREFKFIREAIPDALLVLVPRHPERFDSVAIEAKILGWELARKSSDNINQRSQVILVDTMGELLDFLAASDICVMGGSFVDTGAHNPLEPAALSVPIIMGPSQFNFAVICQQLEQAGGLKTIKASQLDTTIIEWLKDAELRQCKGEAAKQVMEANRGAKQYVLRLIEQQLTY